MHSDPNPLFHRDIRWPNIIRCASNSQKWFLIDWDDASLSPTKAAPHLQSRSHPPSVFQDNHGAEVDLWEVGMLLLDATVFARIPEDVLTVGEQLKAGTITTARDALRIVLSFTSC
jgi:hypothetical protein